MCMCIYWIKHVEQLQAVQEHTVIYLFLNCRAALNSLDTVASDSAIHYFWLKIFLAASIVSFISTYKRKAGRPKASSVLTKLPSSLLCNYICLYS